jgi:hypothetical protein
VLAVVALSIGSVGLMRVLFEGRYYDYSLASMPGDVLLGAYLTLISWALQRETTPGIHDSMVWHIATFVVWLITGVALQARAWIIHGGRETIANSFHNLVIVSLFGYTVFSTLPLLGGRTWSRNIRVFSFSCLLGWLCLLTYDIQQGNLDKNTPW